MIWNCSRFKTFPDCKVLHDLSSNQKNNSGLFSHFTTVKFMGKLHLKYVWTIKHNGQKLPCYYFGSSKKKAQRKWRKNRLVEECTCVSLVEEGCPCERLCSMFLGELQRLPLQVRALQRKALKCVSCPSDPASQALLEIKGKQADHQAIVRLIGY